MKHFNTLLNISWYMAGSCLGLFVASLIVRNVELQYKILLFMIPPLLVEVIIFIYIILNHD